MEKPVYYLIPQLYHATMEGATELPLYIVADGFFFSEAPRYRNSTLYMSDMTGCKIGVIDMNTRAKDVLVEVENQPNACASLTMTLLFIHLHSTPSSTNITSTREALLYRPTCPML